jgi:hypothetical protein
VDRGGSSWTEAGLWCGSSRDHPNPPLSAPIHLRPEPILPNPGRPRPSVLSRSRHCSTTSPSTLRMDVLAHLLHTLHNLHIPSGLAS